MLTGSVIKKQRRCAMGKEVYRRVIFGVLFSVRFIDARPDNYKRLMVFVNNKLLTVLRTHKAR